MRLLIACLLALMPALLVAGDAWPTAVPGFVPPAAGEHPRLLLRKTEVPALRKKAGTPEGKAIVARLKYLLGGGEAMPTEYNPNPPLNIGPKGPEQLKPGAFTVNHAAGFALLWLLTGEARYADLSRQCLDKVFAGQVDRDERYSWLSPGTGFRMGGVHVGVALAYDLCYDGWSEDYRRKVVQEILDSKPKGMKGTNGPCTLELLCAGGKYPPSSNHFGAYLPGGLSVMAIRGDPGADEPRLAKLMETLEKSMTSELTSGFGDGGWLGEGAGSDRTAVFPGVAPVIQAMRVAAGKDFGEGAPNGRMVVLARVLELVPTATEVSRPGRGHYGYGTKWNGAGRDGFHDKGGWSKDGVFSMGMGALPERFRPGMAWVYEHFIEPDMKPEERIYDARIDPIHAVFALINYPIGKPTANPAETFPMAFQDTLHGYVLCRNRFQDGDDCMICGLARRGPTGYHHEKPAQTMIVWGLGLRTQMGSLSGKTTHWAPGKDGSACFTVGEVSWGIDYSGAAGCPAVVVNVGGKGGNPASAGQNKATPASVTAGGKTFNLLLLHSGAAPEAKADGDKVVIGKQTIALDGGKIVFGTFTPAP